MEKDNLGEIDPLLEKLEEKEGVRGNVVPSEECPTVEEKEVPIELPSAKPKRERSAKQIEAFEKARQKRDENRKLRAEQKKQQELEQKKELEDKIVQKAITIKKKQILKQQVLDEISDDDTPIQEIKQKIVKRSVQQVPQIAEPKTPKFQFI